MEPGLAALHARYAPVDARVAEILDNIRRDCRELERESRNQGNERQVEEFIDRLRREFRERVVIERQRLSTWAVRTTRWTYLFPVPGDRPALATPPPPRAAPPPPPPGGGAPHPAPGPPPGGNKTTPGEEIVKQY